MRYYTLFLVFLLSGGQIFGQYITTIAGTTTYGHTGDGGTATAAKLHDPWGVAIFGSNMYVGEIGNWDVRKVNLNTGVISTFAGSGTNGYSGDGGPATAADMTPVYGIGVDGTGNVYIADDQNFCVREVNTSGIITTVAGIPTYSGYSGDGGAATSAKISDVNGIAVDSAGNIFIADASNYCIRKVNTSGIISTYAGTGYNGYTGDGGAATAAKCGRTTDVAVDNRGNVFIGDYGNNVIRKVNSSGVISTIVGTGATGYSGDGGAATAAHCRGPLGMYVNSVGNLFFSDMLNDVVREVDTSGVIWTIAGRGSYGATGDGGPATAAYLEYPAKITGDIYNNLYVSDMGNSRIRKIWYNDHPPHFTGGHSQSISFCENTVYDSVNSLLTVLDTDVSQCETWSLSSGPSHGIVYSSYSAASTGGVLLPFGMSYSPANGYSGQDSFKIMVSDGLYMDSTVIHVSVTSFFAGLITPEPAIVCPGGTVTLTDDTTGGIWSSSNPAIGTVSSSGVVTGMSLGNVVISYTISNGCGSNTAQAMVNVGVPVISTIAGNGTAGYSGDGGQATAAEVYQPQAMVIDHSGNIIFGDTYNDRIRKINGAGVITTIAGNGASTYGSDGEAATSAGLRSIFGIAIDAVGNIYFSDYDATHSNAIRKINTLGIVTTLASSSTRGFSGDGGVATAARINEPIGVAVDNFGNLFFADQLNNRIRKINASGIISTYAGNGTSGFSGDGGPATAAEIGTPYAVICDKSGNILFSDLTANRVRKIDTFGIITTVAGNGTSGNTGDGGMATAAELFEPYGVAVDSVGNVYIPSLYNIRLVNTSGIINTIAGTGVYGFSGDGGPATAAKLGYPAGMAVYGPGSIYYCDGGTSRIREIKTGIQLVDTIIGPSTLCPLGTISLADSTHGGTWSSSATGIATVGSATGVVTGVSSGTVVISYSVPFLCTTGVAAKTITVVASPPPISGTLNICPGGTTALTDPYGSGTWSSSLWYVASIGSSTGVVTGVSTGFAVITFTASTGCIITTTMDVVSTFPGPITPEPAVICVGGTVTLADDTTGGTWSSANPAIATITGGGVVTGVSIGNVIISYTKTNSCGTGSALGVISVGQPVINTIAGTGGLRSGDGGPATAAGIQDPSSVFMDGSGNIYICEVDYDVRKINTSGIISTIAGTSTAGFSGDGGPATRAEMEPFGMCMDGSGNLYVTESNNRRVRKINTSGTINEFAGDGTAGYSGDGGPATNAELWFASGCVADVSGNIYFADPSGYSVIREINTSGIISTFAGYDYSGYGGDGGPATAARLGGPEGMAIDKYGNIYFAELLNYRVRKVNTLGIISTIAGNGSSTYSGDGGPATAAGMEPFGVAVDVAGNVFISDENGAIREVNTSGIITTVAGIGIGGFSGDGGPATSAQVSPYDGGIWVDPSGNLYLADMFSQRVRKVQPGIPHVDTIIGPPGICIGDTIALGDGVSGGTWSSTAPGVASIGSTSGQLVGVSVGTTIISYIDVFLCNSSYKTKTITVYPLPSAIVSPGRICAGAVLSDATSGGTWSSSDITVAIVGSLSGFVHATGTGTVTITYALPSGCIRTATETIIPLTAGVITPEPAIICPGATVTLNDDTSGGIWSSGNVAVGTVSAGGVVTGISPGNVTISYTITNTCGSATAMAEITIGTPEITTIAGNGSTTLTDDVAATASGLGTPTHIAFDNSGNMYVGDYVNNRIRKISTSGVITTVAGNGSTGFTNGVAATASGIYHTAGLCLDASGNLYFADYNGNGVRKVNTSGVVTTLAGSGSFGFSGDGGPATAAETNNPWGVAVDNSGNVYFADRYNYRIRKINSSGTISTYAGNGTSGFSGDGGPATAAEMGAPVDVAIDRFGNLYFTTWSDSRVRMVDTSGTINTVAGDRFAGYSGDGGAATSAELNGPSGICVDTVGNLYIGDYENNRVREVNTSGIISTIAGTGTAGFTGDNGPATAAELNVPYGVAVYGAGAIYICDAFNNRIREINIGDTAINPILGPSSLCPGSVINLADSTSGGTWSSSATGIAIVGVGGAVTGIASGTAIITYTAPFPCGSKATTKTILVNPLPVNITGADYICSGMSGTLTDSTSGGTWTSANNSIATVGSLTGAINGIGAGTTFISYTLPTGCFAHISVTVNPLPAAIAGFTSFCVGSATTLSDASSGGTWTSANISVATAGSLTGVVSGIVVGTTSVTYQLSSGCMTSVVVTVNPLPPAITGTPALCESGGTTTLSDSYAGGTWSSRDVTVALAGPLTGILTGVLAGTTTITYKLISTGCISLITVTVNPLPFPITGITTICDGSSVTLTDLDPGGTWSSSNVAMADVGSASGVVTGVALGSAMITYTLATGCQNTTEVYIYPNPGPITGATTLCLGYPSTLTDAAPGGTWISSNITVAPVIVSSGVVNGASSGTAIITYTLSSGCFTTTTVIVNPFPSAISGIQNICMGSSVTWTDAVSGGTWISSNRLVGSIATTGVLTGVSAGTTHITYTLGGSCLATRVATVLAGPSTISGLTTLCSGASTTLGNTVTGGTWISSNTTTATIGSATGILTGVAFGTSMISYTLSSGCSSAEMVTITGGPTVISGPPGVCQGTTVAETDSVSGGAWSSSGSGIAAIGSSSGVVTGVSTGTTVITYSIGGGCIRTKTIAVYESPAAIVGTTTLCAGTGVTLTDATAGGDWASGAVLIATIGSVSGYVSGVGAGTSVITYTLGNGCTAGVTVNVTLAPTPVAGASVLCTGTSATETDGISGGSWSSSLPAVATIGSGTGAVTGVAAGTTIITYSIGSGCLVTKLMTINASPAGITGVSALCQGTGATLYDVTSGGYWTSGSTSIATVGSVSGYVSGITTGTTIITYATGAGCSTTMTLNVTDAPAIISGPSFVCTGAAITETDAVSGGLWSSAVTAVATIGSVSGLVSGVAAGTVTITYSIGSGCMTTRTITVDASPGAISGAMAICVGTGTTLSDGTGGVWSSSSPGVATISSVSGYMSGVTAGTTIITYNLGTGCYATTTVAVTGSPTAISGASGVCTGLTVTETDGVSGGAWSSSEPVVATIGSTTGLVSGVTAGTTIITYSIGSGCITSKTITVYESPSAITGGTALCAGSGLTLGDAISGGTWLSGTPTVATIGLISGSLNGIAAGTSVITYSVGSGCSTLVTVTVTGGPAMISGPSQVCMGLVINEADGVGGGAWISSDLVVATIGSGTGVVTGLSAGTTIITYSLGLGCITSKTITVDQSPAGIIGTTTLCAGAGTTLSDATSGGTWTSNMLSVATIGLIAGNVTGVTAGTSIITYTLASGCNTTTTVTITNSPNPITGAPEVCTGQSITETDGIGGGNWVSSDAGVAAIGSLTGVVTGMTSGTAIITYSLGTGCVTTTSVVVNPLPAAISGPANLCTITTLSDATPGGTWTSGTTSVATIGTGSGIVTGVSAGTALITYTVPTGCSTTLVVMVGSGPSAIMGGGNVCVGSSVTLSDSESGGTWLGGGGAVTVGSVSGSVTGITAGTAVVTYSTGIGCATTTVINVVPLPPAITGITHVCAAHNTALSDSATGGAWSSGTTSIATVGGGGVVTGVSAGIAVISYFSGGCYAQVPVTVLPLPDGITGVAIGCAGLASILTDTTSGGAWTSSNTLIATIGSASGILTGVTGGGVTITYSLPTGCYTTTSLVVHATPASITGSATLCVGATTVLRDATLGGAWTFSGTAITMSGSGTVTGVSAGTATISYGLGGCAATREVTVNRLPDPITGPDSLCAYGATALFFDADTAYGFWASTNVTIDTTGLVTSYATGTGIVTYTLGTGCAITRTITIDPLPAGITGLPGYLCPGGTATLADASPGGYWSAGPVGVASIGSLTGVVTGIATGVAGITYTIPTGCAMTGTIAVNPQPAAITGSGYVCAGSVTTFADATSGGLWSSGSVTIAVVGSLSGVVSGVSPGTAGVTYTVINSCGASSTEKTVTVNPVPDAGTIAGQSTVCTGAAVTLSETVTGGAWSLINALATDTAGVVTGLYTGLDTVVYTVSRAGCSASATYTLNIVPPPVAGTVAGPNTVCAGATITLTDDAGGGVWSATNGNATVTGGVVSGQIPGSDTVLFTVTNSGCSAVAALAITISAAPDAGAITGPNMVCTGDSMTLADAATGGTWSASDPLLQVNGGVVAGLAAGLATVSYIVSNDCGSAVATHTVTINIVPDAGTITGQGTVCSGDTILLTDAAAGGIWVSANNGIATVNGGYVTGMAAGTDTISYEVINPCGVAVAAYEVTVQTSPSVPVISQGAVSVSVSSAYATYQWSVGGSKIPGATTLSYTFSPGSIYQVSVTNAGGCSATSAPFTAGGCDPGDIRFYPNPAATVVNIEWCKAVTVRIMDAAGRQVRTVENTKIITWGDLPNAVYMLELFDEHGNKLRSEWISKMTK